MLLFFIIASCSTVWQVELEFHIEQNHEVEKWGKRSRTTALFC